MKIKMTRRLLAALIFAGFVAALFAWPFLRLANQPRYQGRTLDYWFMECCRSNNRLASDYPRFQKADAALREIGTNAVPYLLEIALAKRESKAKEKLIARIDDILDDIHFLPHQPLVGSNAKREEAELVLKEIKPPANQLLALLDKRLKSKIDLERREGLYLLGSAGDGAEMALPYLESALHSSNIFDRVVAIQSLSCIGPPAGAAAPALIEVLGEPAGTNHLSRQTAIALGKIGGPQAAPAIPLVKRLFEQETNWNMRTSLAVALFRLDATQQEAIKFLMDGLTNHQPAGNRWIAAMQLGSIGPGARDAVPALIAALDAATNAMLFAQIPRALKAIGVPVESFLPRMTAQLNSISNDENTRVTTAARVLEFDPSNHEAHLVLIESIKKRSGPDVFAMDALGRAGPAAREALPVLREATTNPYGSARETALRAIKEIEAQPDHGK